MPIAFRLKLDPITGAGAGDAVLGIGGTTLSFQQQGAKTTSAKRDSPQPARITFQVALSKRARGERETETFDIDGAIEGSLEINGKTGKPVFVVKGQPKFPEPEIKSSDSGSQVRPRCLALQLRAGDFDFSGEPIYLYLPKDLADGFHYAELHAELELAGSADAARAVNDVLDVPLLPRRKLRVCLVDQQGTPIADQPLELLLGEETVKLTTNARGEVSIENPACDVAKVTIPEPAALRDKLKERWQKSSVGPRLHEADDLRVVHLTESLEPIPVQLGKTTLSVQPRVRLARLRGTFFDENRCFLLPAGVSSLAQLVELHAEAPHCEALIVGHTDKSGAEDANLDLSLARAEAVKAYLSDDASAWLAWYGKSKPQASRWGQREDKLMAEALLPNHVAADGGDWASAYRDWHNAESTRPPGFAELPEEGAFDDDTRKQLILDYMAIDGTTLPKDASVTTHGCGESFLLSQWGERADGSTDDDDPLDLRLEVFLFERSDGILPKPPGAKSKANSTVYPEWLRRADRKLANTLSLGLVQIWLHDMFGRRMGKNPKAEEPADRERGAPYCLVIPPGQTRTGYADEEGLLVERDLIVKDTCLLYWGVPEPQPEQEDDAPERRRRAAPTHGTGRSAGRALPLSRGDLSRHHGRRKAGLSQDLAESRLRRHGGRTAQSLRARSR